MLYICHSGESELAENQKVSPQISFRADIFLLLYLPPISVILHYTPDDTPVIHHIAATTLEFHSGLNIKFDSVRQRFEVALQRPRKRLYYVCVQNIGAKTL